MGLFGGGRKQRGEDEQLDPSQLKGLSDIASGAASQLIKELSGVTEKNFNERIPDNVIAFTGAAGGVGASTITANIGYILAQRGYKVLIVDLNMLMPIQHTLFNAKQAEKGKDFTGFLLSRNILGDAITVTSSGVSLLYSVNSTLADSIRCESESAVKNFEELVKDLRLLYDIVLLDCPMRIDNTICNMGFYLADHVYIVWDESISCISNMDRIKKNMALTGIDLNNKLKVILNKRTSINYSNYPFEALKLKLIGILPFETRIIEAGLSAEIFCEKAAGGRNSAEFIALLEQIATTITIDGGSVK